MANKDETPIQDAPDFLRKWGFWAVVTGAIALVLVFVQIVGPTFEPKPSVASQVGEIAGEIKRSAWRSLLGLPNQAPEEASPTVWNYVALAAPMLGILAVFLSMISGILRENWRYMIYGTSFGAAAVVFHYFWWLALLVAGVVVLVAIIENLGDIFSLS